MAHGTHSSRAALGACHWLAIMLALCACAERAPQPGIESVTPAEVGTAAESLIEIHGSDFQLRPLVALGSRAPASLRGGFRVRLGAAFETEAVERVDARTLRFSLPAGTRAGTYDLELWPPGAGRLVLRAALTVRDKPYAGPGSDGGMPDASSAADGGGDAGDAAVSGKLTLSLEDAPGGQGKPLDAESTRPAANTLAVYAVLRDAQGAFVTDVSVTWTVEGDPSASPAPDTQLQLPLAVLGDLWVRARDAMNRSAQLGPIHVVPGHATQLLISTDALRLRTSDAPFTFSVTGVDALDHPTTDLGALTWSVVDGRFGELSTTSASSATLTPRVLGSGRIQVTSSYKTNVITKGIIEVVAGTAVSLSILPDTLSVSADDAPQSLKAIGYDALDNETSELGTLSWSIASGNLSALSSGGLFDPVHVGTGRIAVISSNGAQGLSNTYEVRPGRASTLSLAPSTWSATVGDAPVTFGVDSASDADGNPTLDFGALTYAVASGPIGDVDSQSGTLTPRTAGDGTISVTSSHGASAQTGNVHIAAYTPLVSLSALRVSDIFSPGQSAARVEVDVKNDDSREVVLTGMAFSFVFASADVSADYLVTGDRANVDRVAAGTTRTLVYWVDVASTATRSGAFTVTASADVFLPTGYRFTRSASTSTTHGGLAGGVNVSLTAPVAPNNRVCRSASVGFSALATSVFLSPAFAWRFTGGAPATATGTGSFPLIGSSTASTTSAFNTAGAFAYNVTATDSWGYHDTALGQPIYVGSVAGVAADTYPTGPVVVSSPSAGQAVVLSTFPRNNLLQLSASVPVKQCDGTAIAAAGHNLLTAFSDRGLIDPAADADPVRPGLQLALTGAGVLGSVAMRAPASPTEGSTTLYLEYADDTGLVTAAGDTTFRLTGDETPPRVESSYPLTDCSGPCLGSGDALLFQFSEPMALASLANSKVELLSSASCSASVQSDLTGSSARRYDGAARTLFITPPAQPASSYALRVSLPASITDAATTPNALVPLTRCVIVSGAGSSSAAPTPFVVSAGSGVFSPDADGQSEVQSWSVRAYADTIALRLSLSRGRSELRALLVPIAASGDYTLSWDGADGAGRIADLGAYRYDVTAINRAGVASAAASGYVELQGAPHMVSVGRRY